MARAPPAAPGFPPWGFLAVSGPPKEAPGGVPLDVGLAGQTPAGGLVGTDTCLTCHDDKKDQGPHGHATNPRTPMAAQGCETCHGPGKAHVDASRRVAHQNPQSSRRVVSDLATMPTAGTRIGGQPHDRRG
jgi:hypothetical protein